MRPNPETAPSALAELYDTKLLAITDRLAAARTVTVRRCPSDLWHDDECCSAKKAVRIAECTARQSQSHMAQWKSLRRVCRALRKQKSETYWCDLVDSECDREKDVRKRIVGKIS